MSLLQNIKIKLICLFLHQQFSVAEQVNGRQLYASRGRSGVGQPRDVVRAQAIPGPWTQHVGHIDQRVVLQGPQQAGGEQS